MQHPTAPVTHILYCHPSSQRAAMQPLFHLTLKSTKLEQDLQMCKTNIRLVQPVLITSCGKTRRTFSLFQGYPVQRQGQHDWQVGRRTGEGGQYRFAGNPDIEFECSEAAIQDAALPDQGVLCRRLSLKMREAKLYYLLYDAISEERENESETKSAH